MVLDDEQLFVRDGWARRLNVPRRDFGTGMTPAEGCDLSSDVDLDQVLAYSDAVIARTLDVVRSLSAEELDRVNDPSYVQGVVDRDYVVTEDTSRVPAYMNGQTRGFFLIHLALTHKFVHYGEANSIRGLMGQPGREPGRTSHRQLDRVIAIYSLRHAAAA
jgi:hypothetical protein